MMGGHVTSMIRIFTLFLIGLIVSACASRQTLPPPTAKTDSSGKVSEATSAASEAAPTGNSQASVPAPVPACEKKNKMYLINRVGPDELPVLMSSDHKTWRTVTLKSQVKTEFDVSNSSFFVHTGKETRLDGGQVYAIVIRKGSLMVVSEADLCRSQ